MIVGRASWYGQAAAGRKTATGEKLDPRKLTAASTVVPLQSRALVTDLENGRSVRVRINDCGPYTKGRTLDVSKRAAEQLDMTHSGTVPVNIKLIAMPPDVLYCPRPAPARRRSHSHFRRRIGALTKRRLQQRPRLAEDTGVGPRAREAPDDWLSACEPSSQSDARTPNRCGDVRLA